MDADPLRIERGEESTILSTTILKKSREVIGVTCNFGSVSPWTASFTFEYLDPGDGCVIEILHTGERRHPKLFGTVKGIPQGLKNLGALLSQLRTSSKGFPKSRQTIGFIAIAIGILMSLAGTFISFKAADAGALKNKILTYGVVIFGLLYAGLGCMVFWITRRRYPRSLQTEDLE